MDTDIKEGFLCPICFKDLKSPTNLSSHFEEFHQDDKAVLQQLRKAFGKAKQKILNKPDYEFETTQDATDISGTETISLGTPATGGIDLALWHPQDIGEMFSHSRQFRDRRKETVERCVIETNQLIIRLGKLMKKVSYNTDSSLPGASKAKKNAERSCVPWQNDADVKFCPSCNKKFTLTFRKHHCRLCGKIVCLNCLYILDIDLAESVLKGGGVGESSTNKSSSTSKEQDFQNGLKTCLRCEELLERQNKLYLDKIANVALVRLYEKMQSAMQNADLIQPMFNKMAESVNAGETEYGLEKAMLTRQKLLKSYETVEALSKHIQQLGLGNDKEPSPRALKLQSTIRAYASNYLADNMFTLPGLPSQDKYNEMLKEKEEERERIKKEKLLSAAAAKKNSLKTNRSSSPAPTTSHAAVHDPSAAHYSSHNQNTSSQPIRNNDVTKETVAKETYQNNNNSGFFRTSTSMFKSWKKEARQPAVFQAVSISKSKDSSWGPVQVSVDDTSDPVVQQIKILESYIQQARDDERWDEVKMFEQNLRELHLVYLEQKRLKQGEAND